MRVFGLRVKIYYGEFVLQVLHLHVDARDDALRDRLVVAADGEADDGRDVLE